MEIYTEEFVETLFNRMSKTYGVANYVSSFGFTERWRRQCVREINWGKKQAIGYDLMSGMGESWNLINTESQVRHQLIGVDLSREMNKMADKNKRKYPKLEIEIEQQNVLKNEIPDNTAEYIISTFGLKTFSQDQLKLLAKEVKRILKPNGEFSMVEISKPTSKILLVPYMLYLKYLIPIIGKVFMGDAVGYRMLGVYCNNFKDCSKFKTLLENEGLEVEMKKYFFGCATGVVGRKPS